MARILKNNRLTFDNGVESVLDNISEPFALINKDYRFVYLNSKAKHFFDIPEESAGRLTLWDVFPFEKDSKLSEILIQAFLKKTRVSDDFYSAKHQRWYHITAYSSNNGIALLFTDIHQKKIAQENLKERENTLRLILNSIPHIAFIMEENAEMTLINKRWTEYTGMQPEEAMGSGWQKIFHPDDLKRKIRVWKEKAHSGLAFETEFRAMNAHGEYHWFWDRIVPLVIEDGKITLWLGTATDIQHLKNVEMELRQSKRFLESVLNFSPDIILLVDYPGNSVIYVNSAMKDILGFSSEDIERRNLEYLEKQIHPEDIDHVRKYLQNLSYREEGEFGTPIEHRIRDGQGNWRWILMRSVVFSKTQTGRMKEVLTFITDITSYKKAQKSLGQSSHLIKQITETSPDTIIVFDMRKGKFVYINKPFSAVGYSADQLKKLTFEELRSFLHPDDQLMYEEYYQRYKSLPADRINEVEYRIKTVTGKTLWLRERGKVFKTNEQGQPIQYIANLQEITDEKEAEAKKHENELLSQLVAKKDEFMSVASHELKTPITTIKASIQLMKRMVEKHADEKMLLLFLEKSNQQINKLTGLISDLMDNAKLQAGKIAFNFKPFRVEELIEDCLYHNTNHHTITVHNSVTHLIEADKIRIEQVLNNFIGNAIKYSPKENEVILDVSEVDGFMKVAVTDFGIGIPRENLPHVFDRFYRVDNKSQEFSGLGLGLYICSEIIRRHDGEYGVSSEPGKGSTFWFKIPIKHKTE